jgi:hypothetical protein
MLVHNRSDDARVAIKSLFMSVPAVLSIYSLHGSGHCAVRHTLLTVLLEHTLQRTSAKALVLVPGGGGEVEKVGRVEYRH